MAQRALQFAEKHGWEVRLLPHGVNGPIDTQVIIIYAYMEVVKKQLGLL